MKNKILSLSQIPCDLPFQTPCRWVVCVANQQNSKLKKLAFTLDLSRVLQNVGDKLSEDETEVKNTLLIFH